MKASHAHVLRIAHGIEVAPEEPPTEPTPKDIAGGAVREALADFQASLEGGHAGDSPELVGAQARLDRALEQFREAPEAPPEPDVDMDGGARRPFPQQPPSHESTLLALIEEADHRVEQRAREIDRRGF